jgi:Zn-dependent metalloprotease
MSLRLNARPLAALASPAVSVPKSGPLPLESAEAKAAIQKSLAFLEQSAGKDGTTFVATSVEKDALGMTHVRFDREAGGKKLFNEMVIAHLGADGAVKDVSGNAASVKLETSLGPPSVTEKDALAIAKQAFRAELDAKLTEKPVVETTLYPAGDGHYVPAYRVELASFTGNTAARMNYLIDANTGEVLESFNTITQLMAREVLEAAAAQAPATGTDVPPAESGTGHSMYSGTVPLSTKRDGNRYVLVDDSRNGSRTESGPLLSRPIRDNNNIWGEASDPKSQKAAIDAHYGMEMTWDFYKNVLGRNSIDDNGFALKSRVHVGIRMNNAFWNGVGMNYGDGDGRVMTSLTALDIAGHEISHGLIQRSAALTYNGESGGLNESMADILGTGVEWYASQHNPNVKFDWGVGEDAFTPNRAGDAMRYLDDPTRDQYSIDHFSKYPQQREVHGSSGIANNAFYLLAEGGTNKTSGLRVNGGIGIEKGLKIFYRALAYYMTPNTTFAQARQFTLQAAKDLYGEGSEEARKVAEAWSAVGVN